MEIQHITEKFRNRKPSILGSEDYTKFAVLLPLIKIKDELHVLFEVRSLQLRRQPGEVCFPGGKCDLSDKDECHTAIRETSEELGIDESDIVNIFPLDFMLSPFGTIIYPFVGFIENSEGINPNSSEVEEIFTVPLSFFKETKPEIFEVSFKVEPDENFPYNQIIGGEKYNWQARKMEEWFYYYEDRVIWGMTARIIGHFISVIKND